MRSTVADKSEIIDDLRARVLDLEEEIKGVAGFLHVHGISVSKHLAEWDRKSMGTGSTDRKDGE